MSAYALTPEQEAIRDHDPSLHARVLAGPGTGKSAALVSLVERLHTRIPRPRIRLLTFTRAATAELAQKVCGHSTAATERPSTMHSFAISLLLRNVDAGDLPAPLRIADDWEDKEIVRKSLAKRAKVTMKELKILIREMESAWTSLSPERDPDVEQQVRDRFLGAWREHRQIYGYTLLSELPYALRGALQDHPDFEGADYDLLIVDEYQDLNACDLAVLKLLAQRGASIVAAGDDDQSIYFFRRAAPEGIRNFPADYPASLDYPLSVAHRCGRSILNWARHVIEGDPDRPRSKPPLTCGEGCPAGEVALLSFPGHISEARGIAKLVRALVQDKDVRPEDLLILLRTDDRGRFSSPIKKELDKLRIPYSDPDSVKRMLAEPGNRRLLECFRLLVHRQDSIAWASLLRLTDGVGEVFTNYIYERARRQRSRFGKTFLDAYEAAFAGGPKGVSSKARSMAASVLAWLDTHVPPQQPQAGEWGTWIIDNAGGGVVPSPSDDLRKLLLALDELVEEGQELGRFLGQIGPLGKDTASARGEGVRIMTLGGAKGLTVRGTIIGALEEEIIPHPDGDPAEERRLLYVGMTRAREFLFGTWAGQRRGQTARAGIPRVGQARRCSPFLRGGPVESEGGDAYLRRLG